MKHLLFAMLGTMALMACAENKPIDNTQNNTQNNTQDSTIMESKALVVFFSRTGENYSVGTIEKGNTHIVAEMIAEAANATLFQITPVTPYPEDYSECTRQAQTERTEQARPALKEDIAVEAYDTVYIGYPIWWSDMPMPVYTFLESHDWRGKVICPFCTHEGSGLGSTPSYLRTTCAGATVSEGLAIRGTTAQTAPAEARQAVQNWIAK